MATLRMDTYNMDHGCVVFYWPDQMGEDEIADFMAWVDLVKRKVARIACIDRPEPLPAQEPIP